MAALLTMSLIGGIYMWFSNYEFFFTDFPRMTYFGDDWVAKTWSAMTFAGGLIWAIAAIMGSIAALIWGIVQLLSISSGTLSHAADKVWEAVTPSDNFKEAVGAVYHKYCPKLEIILPKGYEGYVVGARVTENHPYWDEAGDVQVDVWRAGTIVKSTLDGNRLELEILWDTVRDSIYEHFAKQDVIDEAESPEELEASLRYMLSVRTGDRRLWFKSDNSDFKLLVEETDSPQ